MSARDEAAFVAAREAALAEWGQFSTPRGQVIDIAFRAGWQDAESNGPDLSPCTYRNFDDDIAAARRAGRRAARAYARAQARSTADAHD